MRYFRNPNFISFCFLILIKPGCISGIPALEMLDTLLNMMRILLVFFSLIVFFKNVYVLPVNRLLGVTMLVVASILWEPLSTLIAGGSVADFGALMNDLGIALMCYIGLRAGYDSFIEGVAKVSGAYVLINCLTVILFPAGMYATKTYSQNFFLSYRTAWFVVYLLALTTTLLWNANVGSRFTKRFAIAVAAAAALSMILQWTATGLFCFAIGGLILLYFTWKKKNPLKITTVMLTEAAAFWAIVIARLMNMFSFLLVNILHKDVTLTSRTRIWDNALAVIQQNFLTGVGRLDATQMKALLGYGVSHPHNRYLYVTLCFGIIGLILFLLIVYYANKGVVSPQRLREGRIMMAAYIVLLSAAQVESFSATGGYAIPLYLIAAALHCREGRKKETGEATAHIDSARKSSYYSSRKLKRRDETRLVKGN